MIPWLKLVAAIAVAEAIEHIVEAIFLKAKHAWLEYRSRQILRKRSRQLYR
jgi:hypothetical protein